MAQPRPISAVILKPRISDHPRRERLCEEINGPQFVADLLLERGIEEKEEARRFFLAALDPVPPGSGVPPLAGVPEGNGDRPMLCLDKAVDLLLAAHGAGEKVVVHGDYDVDGVTATALLYQGLKACGFQAGWFLPNRFREGYGITFASVEKIRESGGCWIVSVDTGIAAVAEVARAKELGLKVIITDHHQAAEILPAADAIVNPNQPGCLYPNKGLSGVGVAYKLLDAVSRRLTGEGAERFLDLLALGSLADNVPLLGENRSLVKTGLKLLATSPNVGIRALLDRLGMDREGLSSGDILFKVTPMLNAMGRMGSPEISLRLLLSESAEEAASYLDQMVAENARRRKLDQDITVDAIRMVEEDPGHAEGGCLVLASREWHEGVIGIVAARMVERYRRPAFVIAINPAGMAKGSGRTVPGFNLYKALAGAAHLLEKWGGHYHACGFSIREEKLEALRVLMNQAAADHLAGNDFVPRLQTHVEIGLDSLNADNMLWIRRFEPFGPLNEHPLFYSEDVELLGEPRIVGEKHLKLTLGTARSSFDAIGFNLGYLQENLRGRPRIAKIAYYPEWNTYRGARKIQLRLVAVECEGSEV